MTIINTGLDVEGLKSTFFERFDATKTIFADISTRVTSTKGSETYKWLGAVPQLREWGTGRKTRSVRTESYSVENLKYESSLEIDRDEISDDQTGQISIRVEELAEHAATHKDYLIASLLANGETAGFNAYDGKPFFAADHVSGKSGSQSNKLQHTGTADTSNPTTAEFKEALKAAMSAMMGFKNDQGEPRMIGQGSMVVLCPPNQYFAALEAVNATIIANTTNVLSGAARVISFPWLSNATKFYLLHTGGVIRPFIFQDREPIEFNGLDEGSESVWKREVHEVGVRARYRMTYGEWMFAVRQQFAA